MKSAADQPGKNQLRSWNGALTYYYYGGGAGCILIILGWVEPSERSFFELPLNSGRFVNYSPEAQAHAVELEIPQYDLDDIPKSSLFDWFENHRGAWSIRCNYTAESIMVPSVFTFEDANTALEFKLTFG